MYRWPYSFYLLFTVTVLTVDGEGASSVKVTLNPYCRDNRNFTVYFGVRQQGCGECVPQQSKTASIAPGQSVILTPILMLDQGEEYCSPNATLTPGPGRFGDQGHSHIFMKQQHLVIWIILMGKIV